MDLLDQIVNDIVNEVVNGGRRICSDLSVNGETAISIADFKTKLAEKLREANGGGGENFGNADLTLTAARSHDANHNDLYILNNSFLYLSAVDDPETTEAFIQLIPGRTYLRTNGAGANFSYIDIQPNLIKIWAGVFGSADLQIENIAASKKINVLCYDTTSKSVTYSPVVNTADNFANDAAAAVGGIPVGGLYHTSGTVKIRLA